MLDSLRRVLDGQRDAYWATIDEAQRLAAPAWAARAEGNAAEAVRLASQAAELEAMVEKLPVTPDPRLPARELEADLLLELGRPDGALRSYESTLEREPRRRGHGIRSWPKSWRRRIRDRPELHAARDYLSQR